MSFKLCLLIFLAACQAAYPDLLFKPLFANPFEPRIGSIYQFDSKKLRLDIGASVDLVTLKTSDSLKFSAGADFFTYTRLRSENNFKFPVETSDYYFGINTAFKGQIGSMDVSTRVRLAHISSHLVDGMAVGGTFTETPFVYSREFVEFTGTLVYGGLRYYAGFNWAFSTKPDDTKVFTPHIGFDTEKPMPLGFLNDLTGLDMNFLFGVDMKFINVEGHSSEATSSQIGLLIKTSDSAGLIISYYNYYGKSIHGMFYDLNDRYQGIGFQVYFY